MKSVLPIPSCTFSYRARRKPLQKDAGANDMLQHTVYGPCLTSYAEVHVVMHSGRTIGK